MTARQQVGNYLTLFYLAVCSTQYVESTVSVALLIFDVINFLSCCKEREREMRSSLWLLIVHFAQAFQYFKIVTYAMHAT